MTKRICIVVSLIGIFVGGTAPARSQSGGALSLPQRVPGEWSVELESQAIRERMAGLALDAAVAYEQALHVVLPAPEQLDLLQSGLVRDVLTKNLVPREEGGGGSLPLMGVTAPAEVQVRLTSADLLSATDSHSAISGGVMRATARGKVCWTAAIESAGAGGIRLHLANMDLPEGASIYIYGIDSEVGDAHGPYTGRGVMDSGEMWTHTIFSDTVFVELQIEASALGADVAFDVDRAVHMGGPYFRSSGAGGLRPRVGFGETNDECKVDVQCPEAQEDWPLINFVSGSVGRSFIIIQQGDLGLSFSCSGNLVADTDPTTFIPYYLTSNSCVDSQELASTMETFFFDVTSECDGEPPAQETLPSIVGADLLVTRDLTTLNDFSFLRLADDPPPGATLLNWTQDVPTPGEVLYRISHPADSMLPLDQVLPQQYSRHRVVSSRFTCEIPHENYVHTISELGAVQSGSAGAALMNVSGEIVGQMFGFCGSNFGNICDNSGKDILDGSFAKTFPLIESFLTAAGKPPALKIPKRGGIKFNPRKPIPGQTVEVRIKVKNTSRKGTAFGFFVRFWSDLASPPLVGQGGEDFEVGPITLGPRQSTEIIRTFIAPPNTGKHFAYGFADADDTVIEKREKNNIRKKKYKVKNP